MENQVLTPHVYWAQRHHELYLRVELSDVQVKAGRRDVRRVSALGTRWDPRPLFPESQQRVNGIQDTVRSGLPGQSTGCPSSGRPRARPPEGSGSLGAA